MPEPLGLQPARRWDEEWTGHARRQLDAGGVFLAEDDGKALGVAKIDTPVHGAMRTSSSSTCGRDARRQGVAKALLRECVAACARARASDDLVDVLTLERTCAHRSGAGSGSTDVSTLDGDRRVDALDERLAEEAPGERARVTHVQTDDEVSVERAVAQFLPRLDAPDVRDDGQLDPHRRPRASTSDRDAHGRFARELSDRLGAVTVALALEGEVVRFRLYERGRMVDEYLSVPTYYGPLPKGDELALAANPTLVVPAHRRRPRRLSAASQ